jgi:hypothetical protein
MLIQLVSNKNVKMLIRSKERQRWGIAQLRGGREAVWDMHGVDRH